MEETKKVLSREEIPAEDKWAIEDLYASDDLWEAELETVKEDQQALAGFAGKLGESGETLFAFLQTSEASDVKANKLGNYCMRKSEIGRAHV